MPSWYRKPRRVVWCNEGSQLRPTGGEDFNLVQIIADTTGRDSYLREESGPAVSLNGLATRSEDAGSFADLAGPWSVGTLSCSEDCFPPFG